jgi:hypothetical protein
MSSQAKEYKWQVKAGGQVPLDSVEMKTAISTHPHCALNGPDAPSCSLICCLAGQTGSTSQKQSLAIDKGSGQAPGIGVDAVGIQTAIHAPTKPVVLHTVDTRDVCDPLLKD